MAAKNPFDEFDQAAPKANPFDEFDAAPAEPSGTRSALAAAGDVGTALLKGAVGLPAAVVGLADIPTGGRVGKALEEVGYRPGDAKAIIDDWYSNEQKAANAAVQKADGFVDTTVAALQNPSSIAGAAIESLPQMLGGAGVARGLLKVAPKVAPWLAGAAGEGVLAAGAAADEARSKSADGLLTGKQALAAVGAGAGTAAFGAAGGKLAQRFGLGDVDTMLAAGTSKLSKAPPGFIKQVIGSGISEGVFEELPQSIQEKMWENWGNGKPLGEGVGNAAAMGLLTGAAMGVAGGGYSAARNSGAAPSAPVAPGASVGATGATGATGAGAPVDASELLGEAGSRVEAGSNSGLTRVEAGLKSGEAGSGIEATPDPLTAEPSAPTALPPVRAVPGLATSFTTETGSRLDANYALVEADELQTSHDVNLRVNPNYPAELQPRQRERAASAQQIASIVGRLDPARLGLSADAGTGAPIIGEDGLVESGNARTIAVKRVYQAAGQKADDYKDYLRANAAQFGLTPEQIDGMQQPVLVRLRTTPVNRAEFARQANASTVAQMAPSELAKADSNRIDSMEDLRPDDSGDFATSREFIRRFMTKLPGTEQAGMIDAGGRLSSAGYARVRNAVLAKAYGDSPVLTRMVESMDDNQRNITKALMIAAPRVAQARAAIADGRRFDADITPHLVGAAESLSSLKDAGTSVDDALAQAGLLGEEFTPETRELLRFLADNVRRPRKIADFITAYFDALDAVGDPAQGSLLGETQAPTTTDLMGAARRSTGAPDATGNATNPKRGDDREAAPAGDGTAGQPADAAGGPGGAEGNGAAGAGADPNIEGEPQDSDWVRFAPDSGTAGIPRSHLPQFPAEANGALTNFLKARGIKHRIVTVKASKLKPSQAEYSPAKVERAGDVDTGAAIPVSSDGYVIDGHHRWLNKVASNSTIKIMRLDKPLQEVLDAATNFPSAEVDPDSPVAKRAAAVADFKDAAADVAQILTQHQRAALVPEDTPGLMDALTRLFTAAIKIAGTDLRAATRWVRDQMKLDPALKPLANKIDPATYKKAALKAIEAGADDLLGGQAREPGETDKAFAKRVIDKRQAPAALPENHGDYFTMDGARVVPIADLISTKSAEDNGKGRENGAKRMVAAAAGELSKREPILVKPAAEPGKFEVVDGNGTLASVSRYGWKALPVTVVATIDGRPYSMERDNFKEPPTTSFMQQELVDLARRYVSKFASEAPPLVIDPALRAEAEALIKPMIERAAEAKPEYDQKIIDIAQRLGAVGQKIAPLKKIGRSAEKLATEPREEGAPLDPGVLKDLLRSTIVVSTYADAQAVVDEIYREFKVMKGRVKDRTDANIQAPDVTGRRGFLPSGYGDVLINVVMPNGAVAEIQINVPEMMSAKENEGHKLYEVERSQEEGSEVRAAVIAAQADYYRAASLAEKARAAATASKNAASLDEVPDRGITVPSRSSPDVSSSLNTRPSGNLTQSSPEKSAANEQPGGNESGARTDSILQAQTPDELKAKAAREKAAADADAAEQRRLENKARADADVDRFELTGSDRPADAAGQDSLFERRGAKYNPSQGDLFAQQLDLFLDSKPDDSQAGAATEEARARAADALRVLRRDGTLLGKALSGGLAERQRADLVGQVAKTPEDLATLAQVYRDPRFETFRVFFTGPKGRILGQAGLTSRLPGSTQAIIGKSSRAYLAKLLSKADELGATGFYMLHNHPSGNATPSSADLFITRAFAQDAEAFKPHLRIKFKGHVVIDTNEFSVIDEKGNSITKKADFGAVDPFTGGDEWLGKAITSPQDVMEVAKRLEVTDDAVTLIALNNQNRVMHIASIPGAALTGTRGTAVTAVRRAILGSTAAKVVAVSRSEEAINSVGRHALALDAILVRDDGSTASMAERGLAGDEALPDSRGVRVTADTSPKFDYLRQDALDERVGRALIADAKSRRRVAQPGGTYTPGTAAPAAPTAAERADTIIQAAARTPAPLDAAFRMATKVTGIERATTMLYGLGSRLIDRLVPERVKAGVISDYGVPEAVIDQRAQMQGSQRAQLKQAGALLEKLATMTRAESRVAYEWMSGDDTRTADELMKDLPEESVKVLEQVREMVDKLSQEALRLGQLDAEAFKRHRFAYLRRSYFKHATELTPSEKTSRQRAISILGDQYKGRGMTAKVPMRQVQNSAPEWWKRKMVPGKADTSLKGETFERLERRVVVQGDSFLAGAKGAPSSQSGLGMTGGSGVAPGKVIVKTRRAMLDTATPEIEGLDPAEQKTKLAEVVYWPVGETKPAKYADWESAGTWEVRDTAAGDLVMWRDFTKAERVKMGEIDEARYAIAKTLHRMVHDVEVGRYLEWLSQRYAKKPGEAFEGEIVEASERFKDAFKPGEWVQVPDTKIPGTSVMKYGALAGRYLPGPVWNDLRQVVNGRFQPLGENYQRILSMWKTAKTALSPGVHTNNVMSNFVMADWHDVSAGHVSKALRILLAAQQGDGKGAIGRTGNAAARLGIADREAAREILNRYQVSGGAIGGWITQEIANDQIEPIVAALQAEVAATAAASAPAEIGVYSALQHLLHARFTMSWEAFKGSRPASVVATDAQNLINLYQAEDDVFRLAAWLKAKEGGSSDAQAGKVSRKSFLDYSINAPWVAAMRSTAFPFIAYTYRAVPMLLETFAKKPHKILKLMAAAGALNWLGVMLAGGGDDKERKLLPEEKAGRIWGMVPKLIRMPWNDAQGSPVYLDVRRWIPVGDVVDLGAGQAALPLPPAAYPGGPLVILGEIIFNKSAFTGKPITLETDTAAEKTTKLIDHLWKAAMPNIIGVPGTYATEGVVGAAKGRTDAFGREMSVPMAVSSALGVKLGAYPEDVLRRNLLAKKAAQEAEIDKQIADLKRQRRTNRVDDEELAEGLQKQNAKKQDLARKLAEQMR